MSRRRPRDGRGWEAEYAQPTPDPTGSAGLWSALEGYAASSEWTGSSSESRSAIVASWAAGTPVPSFAHRHGTAVVVFEPAEPQSLEPSGTGHQDRVVLVCPVCAQVVLILREIAGR